MVGQLGIRERSNIALMRDKRKRRLPDDAGEDSLIARHGTLLVALTDQEDRARGGRRCEHDVVTR